MRRLTVLEANVDARFTYSIFQRKCVCCLKFFSKDMKKLEKNFWNNFALSINIKNRRNYASRNKGHRLKLIGKSGDPPRAWLHGSLKVWKMVIMWERYIEHNNRYSPWQLWIPRFRVFDLRQLQNGCLLTAEMPQVSHIWLDVGPFDNRSDSSESHLT